MAKHPLTKPIIQNSISEIRYYKDCIKLIKNVLNNSKILSQDSCHKIHQIEVQLKKFKAIPSLMELIGTQFHKDAINHYCKILLKSIILDLNAQAI